MILRRNISLIKTFVVLPLLIFLGLLTFASKAYATTCSKHLPSLEASFYSTDVVFLGKIKDPAPDEKGFVTFSVLDSYRYPFKEEPKELQVYAQDLRPLTNEREWVIWGIIPDKALPLKVYTNGCARTQLAEPLRNSDIKPTEHSTFIQGKLISKKEEFLQSGQRARVKGEYTFNVDKIISQKEIEQTSVKISSFDENCARQFFVGQSYLMRVSTNGKNFNDRYKTDAEYNIQCNPRNPVDLNLIEKLETFSKE